MASQTSQKSQNNNCDKSVAHGCDEAIKEAFQEGGCVVVSNALEPAEVKAIMDELWASPRLLGCPGAGREKLSMRAGEEWPQQLSGGCNFLEPADVFQGAASWGLTGHERIAHLQKLLCGRSDIMRASLGRWGVMRPAAGHPEWKTDESWLHWDQNPWSEPDFVRLQAIACLTDDTKTLGGFARAPGFHKSLQRWGEKRPMGPALVGGRQVDHIYGVAQPFACHSKR